MLPPGQIFCPVGRALDVIGDRWTLVLVRHLLGGPKGFQELRARTGIAPRVLQPPAPHDRRRLRRRGQNGTRPVYQVTGRPPRTDHHRWRAGTEQRPRGSQRRSEPLHRTSPQSILESLPFLLREERAQSVDLTFEIRLTGLGGGVWTVHIQDGACTVGQGFADHADVRYTADARVWCGVALGLTNPKTVVEEKLMTKDGGREAMDYYFHQISRAHEQKKTRTKPKAQSATSLKASLPQGLKATRQGGHP
jgi:DNA-binding HxlR family transcriptional regulator